MNKRSLTGFQLEQALAVKLRELLGQARWSHCRWRAAARRRYAWSAKANCAPVSSAS